MTDPVNPIAAEFGEAEGSIPVIPVKPQQEIEPSDTFQKEMERKSRTVQGKDEDRQAQKENRQLEHEIIVNKPSVDEAEAMRSSQRSILDVQKPSSDKTPSKEVQPLEAVPPASRTSSATDSSTDFSQGQDSFGQNLPTPVPASIQRKEEVEALGKTSSATPLEGEKKKIEVAVDMQSSSGQKDTSSQEKKAYIPSSPEKTEPTPSTTPQKNTQVPVISEPVMKKTREPVEVISPHPQSVPKLPQTTQVDQIHPSQDVTLQLSQPEKKITAPVSSQNTFGQTSQDPHQGKEPAFHIENLQPISPEQTEKLAVSTSSSFVVAPPTEIRKETWISKDEQEKAAGHTKIEATDQSEAADQEQKERDQQEEEKEKYALSQSSQNLLDQIFPDLQATAPSEAIGFDRLPPHILDLFDRLVGVITVMQIQGKTETTLYLSDQQSPLFKGTSVTITSYSTAPMAYNIEFKAPAQTSPVLQKHIDQLKTAFKDPKKEFNFQIHEIMLSLQEDDSK